MNSQSSGQKGKESPCSTKQTRKNGYKYITDLIIDKTHQEFKDNIRFRNVKC